MRICFAAYWTKKKNPTYILYYILHKILIAIDVPHISSHIMVQ